MGTWSRPELRDMVAGNTVFMLDQSGRGRPMPDWLAESAAEVTRGSRSDWSSGVHPGDRAAVFAAWWAALDGPYEAYKCTIRARRSDGVHHFENVMLNLLGQDGIEVLIVRTDLGLITDDDEWDAVESDLLFEATPMAIEYMNEIGLKFWVQGQVEEIWGRTADEMIGHAGLEYIHPRHHDSVLAIWISLATEPDKIHSTRLEIVRPDGSLIWVESTIINRLADERIQAMVVLSHDITEQLAAEQTRFEHEAQLLRSHEELKRSQEEFEILANHVPAAVFRTDGNGRITFANLQWRRLAGVDDTAGTDALASLYDVVADDDRAELEAMLRLLSDPDGPGSASTELRSRDTDRVFSLACQAVGDTGGSLTRPIIGSMADVTSTTELRHQAHHDDLTGLLNRHSIDARLAEQLIEIPARLVVAFVDLDGFKDVNDDFGHDAGDEVLRAVAARLRDAVRPSDDVGRYGGDEFVIICRQASAGAEDAVSARIDHVLKAPIEFAGGTWQPAASIGLARGRAGDDLASILKRADQAMYTTKRAHHAAGDPS